MRVLMAMAVAAAAGTPCAAGIIVLKNGTTLVGKLDSNVVPPCPADAADMPETVEISWPHNGVEGPEGRSSWSLRGQEIRWYDVESDKPTAEYWERYLEAELDKRWHAARERYRNTVKQKPVELVPTPKVELWKGLERRPVHHGGAAINVPLGWVTKTQPTSRPAKGPDLPADDPEPVVYQPEAKSNWSAAAKLALWRSGPLEVGQDLEPWVAKQAAGMAEKRGHAVGESPKVRRTDRGLVITFKSSPGDEASSAITHWRIVLRDTATFYASLSCDEADLEHHKDVLRRCLSTLKVQERE